MAANGEQPRTPRRWRIEITFKPALEGPDGLDEIAGPVQAYLRWLDRNGDRHIVIRYAAIDEWPDDLDELIS